MMAPTFNFSHILTGRAESMTRSNEPTSHGLRRAEGVNTETAVKADGAADGAAA